MEWPFSRVRKIFFRGRNFQEKSLKLRRKSDLRPNFRLRNLEFQSPKKMQFHAPSHSIPPLDSLLVFFAFLRFSLVLPGQQQAIAVTGKWEFHADPSLQCPVQNFPMTANLSQSLLLSVRSCYRAGGNIGIHNLLGGSQISRTRNAYTLPKLFCDP